MGAHYLRSGQLRKDMEFWILIVLVLENNEDK